MTISRLGLAALAASAALTVASPALAHAKLVRSTPAAQSTVAAPRAIALTFNEKIVPAFSSFEIVMVGHEMKVPVRTTVAKDGKTITGSPQGRMTAGAYTINWTIASTDGHRMKGAVPFRVR